jgi:hypothetical protein
METAFAEELAEVSHWDDDPPPKLEEEEMDILAFALWHRGSCPETADEEEMPSAEEARRSHASCL